MENPPIPPETGKWLETLGFKPFSYKRLSLEMVEISEIEPLTS